MWDDDSLENVHFHKVFPQISLREINELERIFLTLIDYKVYANGAEYAKYYFILCSYAKNPNKEFPLQPLSIKDAKKLQKTSEQKESTLTKTNKF